MSLVIHQAVAGIDIRVASPLLPSTTGASYTLSVDDCSTVATIKAGTASNLQLFSVADVRRDPLFPNLCLVDFTTDGSGYLLPSARVQRVNGAIEEHSESFAYDDKSPGVQFKSVGISPSGGQQFLNVIVEANDDTDIQYIGLNVSGLRASDIRAAGGVIAEARKKSFARTENVQRVYPRNEGQNEYTLSLPVDSVLSQEAIAQDVVVLIDAFAVDASGNQSSFSKIAFTGDTIQELPEALVVSSNKVVINNILQTPVISVSVDFQFRGIVNLSGPGNGVQYVSSHPDFVGVTSGGVIYPIKETNGISPYVTVSYPGLAPVNIPVEIDFSKTLTSIQLKGYQSGQAFELSSLNTFYSLPEMEGVFDDGTRAQISSSWSPVINIRDIFKSIITQNRLGQIKSSAVVPPQSPVYVDISLKELPGLSSQIPIIAKDALPQINLKLPGSIQPTQELLVNAAVSDDVGIAEVQFLLDEVVIGTRKTPPFELVMPISEELQGKTLRFSAVAVDSAGQKQTTPDSIVQVIARPKPTVPTFKFELPADGQRGVEKSPVAIQISSSLGLLPDVEPRTGISRVEFFFDGTKIGDANFPLMETRKVKTPEGSADELVELWVLRTNLPEVSTNETSLSVSARVYAFNGAQADAPAKLIRVIKNTAPKARFLQPVAGTALTVSQKLPIIVEGTDDTLPLGTVVELYEGSKLIGSHQIEGDSDTLNSLAPKSESVTFNYTPVSDQLGDTLRFKAKIIDYHQQAAYSEELKVHVKGDDAPTIALSNPTEGASFVSGLILPIRANAVDDLAVAQVDFYVNAKLVGSDKTAPYSYEYETPKNIEKEQVLTLYAVATDSSGKTAESNHVKVTLGHDEEPPVINLASPSISGSNTGDDIADVTEESEFVVKVAGYDNVGVTRLELKGIKKVGNQYILTGNQNDVLTGDDFPLQQIPGALRAYSALRLITAPRFSGSPNVAYDPYDLTVTAYDEVGNKSTVSAVIAIRNDNPPAVTDATFNRVSYFPLDTVQTNIVATDDRAVASLELRYRVGNTVLKTVKFDNTNGLAPMAIVQKTDDLDLSAFDLLNQKQPLRVEVVAYDKLGQPSETFITDPVDILPDQTAPVASISSPIQGARLYSGERVNIAWRAVDDNRLASVEIKANNSRIDFKSDYATKNASGTISYTIPATGEKLTLSITARDYFGNTATTNFDYDIGTDQKPLVSIRHPADGSRFVEGEKFTINALVSDDRTVTGVEFLASINGVLSEIKKFDASEVAKTISENKYFSYAFNTPTKPNEGDVEIVVRATDNAGQSSIQAIKLDVSDDIEPPVVGMASPAKNLELYPGESFEVSGTATDDYFVRDISAYFVTEQGTEIKVPWEVFTPTDRVEQIRVANPASLGSFIAAEKRYVDYKGRVRIPADFVSHAGKTLKFKLRASDSGVNYSDSPSINVLIKVDTEAPVIQIKTPSTLYDRQKVKLDVAIIDNVSVKSYRVSVIDHENRVVLSNSNVNLASVSIQDENAIDLSRYVEIPEKGAEFTLLVEATDSNNNQANKSQKMLVSRDAAPQIKLISRTPGASPLQGGLAFDRLEVSDDFNAGNGSGIATLYTSLGGLSGQQSTRAIRGGKVAGDEFSHVELNYPEAGTLAGSLLINEKAFLSFSGGKLHLTYAHGRPIDSLKFNFANVSTNYTLMYRSGNQCGDSYQTTTVTAADLAAKNGVLTLAQWLPAGVTQVVVRPEFIGNANAVPTFIKELNIELASLPGQLKYDEADKVRSVARVDRMTIQLADQLRTDNSASFIQPGVFFHNYAVARVIQRIFRSSCWCYRTSVPAVWCSD